MNWFKESMNKLSIGDRYRQFNVIYNDGDDLYLSMPDPTG